MPKKSLISITFCAVTALSGLSPALAFAEDPPTVKEYWTFEEARQLAEQYNQALADLCHDDLGCQMDYNAEHSADPGYYISQSFRHSGLLVTSISPHTSKLSLYQNAREADPIMPTMPGEEDSPDHITSLYMIPLPIGW